MATIDSLDIQISASAQKASQAIDILVGKLGNLANALKIDTSKLENIGKIINLGEVSEQAKTVSENIGNMGAKVSQSMKPIQEQAKKAAKDLSQITEQYKDLGKGFTFSGDTSSLKKQIDSYSNALEKAKLKKQELEASGKTEGQMYEYAVRDVLKYENVLESLKSQLSSVEVPHIDLSALNQEELNNWFNNLPTVAQQAAQSITSSLGQIEIPKIEGIDTESLNYNANAMKAVFGEAASEIQNYTEAITRFGEQAGAVLNQPIKTDLSQMSTKELDEWFNNLPSIKAEVEKAAQDINNTLNQIQQPRSINISTESLNYNADAMKAVFGEAAEGIRNFQDAVQTLGSQAGKTLNESMLRMQELGERLKNLEIPPIREENLKKLQSSLEKTESKLDELRANLANGLEMGRIAESVDDKNYVKLQEQIALTEKQAEALRAKIQEVEQQSKTNWAQSLSNALGKVASFAKQAHTSLSRISSVLKRLNTGLNKAVGKFMSLGKSLSHVSKSSKKSELSLSKAFKMILRYGLGIRSVYTLINKLRRAIIEGFKNLALYSDEVNASISMLKGSFETLKNSSAAALSPLLNAIAPALNAIIQLCIRATNAINQFLSAIFGKGYWIKAKDQVVDYADSIKKAGKEAKNGIRQFDELKLISTDSGNGGGADSNAGDMFETLPIEDRFKEAAEKTKKVLEDLFKPLKAAWDSEGKFVMDSWKYALDEIKKLAKDIGRDFLEVWNQEETVAMFEDILHIIGDIGIIVGNLAKNFREAWNTNQVGLNIFENIRDILAVIVHNIRLAADYTVEWSKTLDFYPLLSKIEEWTKSLVPVFDSLSGIVTDFYTKVLLPLAKWTLEQGLPDLLQVFIDFNDKVDWTILRANLAEFWQHLEPFAETIGEGLIIFISRVSDALANFINSDSFVLFLNSIEEWMDNVTPEQVADGITKLVEALILFKLAVMGFSGLKTISEIFLTLTTVGTQLGTMFSGLGTAISTVATFFAGLSAPVLLVAAAIATLVAGLGLTYATNEEVRQSFDEAINSIKEGLQPALEFITNTVLPDLNNGWNKLMEVLSPLGNFLSGMFVSIWQDMINPALTYVGETVLPKVTSVFENLWNNVLVPLGNFIASVLTPVIQIVSDVLTILWQNIVVPLADAIGNILSKAFEGICDIFNETVIPIVNAVIDVFQFLWDNVFSPIVDFLWDTFKPVFEDVFETIGGLIDALSQAFGGLIDFIVGVFTGNWERAWEGVKDIFKGIFNGLVSIVEGVINIIVDGLNFFLGKFNGVVTSIGDVIGIDISIPNIPKVNLPRFAKGGVFRGGNPFMAIVNDQPSGQTNVEAPLKVIKQALREELASFTDKFNNAQLTPTFEVGQFQPMPPPEFDFESRYQNSYQAAERHIQQQYGSGGFGESPSEMERIVYNAVYNATLAAMRNEGGKNVNVKIEGDASKFLNVMLDEYTTRAMASQSDLIPIFGS